MQICTEQIAEMLQCKSGRLSAPLYSEHGCTSSAVKHAASSVLLCLDLIETQENEAQ